MKASAYSVFSAGTSGAVFGGAEQQLSRRWPVSLRSFHGAPDHEHHV